MSLTRFMDDYVSTGRLEATLIKLKVPREELQDMRQSVICHFLDKNFLTMYDEQKGSFSNHVYVGVRNFVVDFFRKRSKQPYTLVLVSARDEDSSDEVSTDVLPGLMPKDIEDPLFVDEIEGLISSDIAWRDVSWSLAYYKRIQELMTQSFKYRKRGDLVTAQDFRDQARDLQDLEVMGFSHLLVFKMFRLGYSPIEISEFTAVSPSRISGMWNEVSSVIRARIKARRMYAAKKPN